MQDPIRPKAPRRAATLLGRVVAAVIVLAVASVGPILLSARHLHLYFNLYGDNVYAPGTWLTVEDSHPLDEAIYAGTWLPAGDSVHTTFADGTPYEFGSYSRLVLRPDHTFELSRLGKYDGNSRLLCLLSEQGTWQVRPPQNDRVAVELNAATLPARPLVERSVVQQRTEEQWSAAFDAAKDDATSHDLAVARDNQQACDTSLPVMGYFLFYLARRGSSFALYQPAGVANYDLTAKAVLLVRQGTK